MADENTTSSNVALYDAQVRAAWTNRRLSDGTKLDLGRTNDEVMFAVTPTSTFSVVVTQKGWQKCSDGSERRATATNRSAIIPNAGGHTHPVGRSSDIIADLPGDEDGLMTRATGKPAYVISARRAFRIEEVSRNNFVVTKIAGKDFSRSEMAKIVERQQTWNRHGGGSGVQCRFYPD